MSELDIKNLKVGLATAIILCGVFFNVIAKELIAFAENATQIEIGVSETLADYEFQQKLFWARVKGVDLPPQSDISEVIEDVPDSSQKAPENECKCDDNGTDEKATENPEVTEKLKPPLKILLIGDSMIEVGLGPELEKELLSYDGIEVYREGRFSTGLNRIDYFDWYKYTDQLISTHQPDILMVMFGANDGQGIVDSKGVSYKLSSAGWDTVYDQRVSTYLKRETPKVKLTYWIGHPYSASGDFGPKFERMNNIYEAECKDFDNVTYINLWDRFVVNGKYSLQVADDAGLVGLVKQDDDVHVTLHGGHVLAEEIVKSLKLQVELE